MSPIGIKRLLDEKPFRPFTIFTGDGSTVVVRSPEFAFLQPGGRTLRVFVPLKSNAKEEEEFQEHSIDVFLITKVISPSRQPRRNGHGKAH
jgi:hypothetical protein